MVLDHKEAISSQLLQLLDAVLVWFSFWLAMWFRMPLLELLTSGGGERMALSTLSWALYVVVPFTPLVLEVFGFYKSPRTKTSLQSFSQLIKAQAVMVIVIGMLSVFVKLDGASCLVLGVGGLLTLVLLMTRDRAVHALAKG